jgi:hypothetical protein
MRDCKEKQLFDDVLEVIAEQYGLTTKSVHWWTVEHSDIAGDGEVLFSKFPQTLTFEIKRWANHMDSEHLVFSLSRQGDLKKMLLLAEYINPRMAERFKTAGLQFMDLAGNIYLEQDSFFLYVKGAKNKTKANNTNVSIQSGKAFMAKGLQVVYTLLREKSAVLLSYRELAAQAEVALGTVADVIKDLEARGFLHQQQQGKTLINIDALTRTWAEGYSHKLKANKTPVHWVGPSPHWWKDVRWADYNAVAGGEIAAAHYTNYLTVQTPLIYADKTAIGRLAQQFRLRKVRPGEYAETITTFVEPFISITKLSGPEQGYAHRLLAYADLMASGDARNMEVAQQLYERIMAE